MDNFAFCFSEKSQDSQTPDWTGLAFSCSSYLFGCFDTTNKTNRCRVTRRGLASFGVWSLNNESHKRISHNALFCNSKAYSVNARDSGNSRAQLHCGNVVKDYTQTSENKLSSTRNWSVNILGVVKKFTGTWKCQILIVLWVASHRGLWHTCGVVKAIKKQSFPETGQKLSHRMGISTEFQNME